jgi:PEP-CTERM motif
MRELGMAAMCAALAIAGGARADVVYDTLSGGVDGRLFYVGQGSALGNVTQAMGFEALGTFDLTQIDLYLTLGDQPDPTADVTLYAADGTDRPAGEIASWHLGSLTNGVNTIADVTGVSVSGGTSYYLGLSSTNAPDYSVNWNENSSGTVGPRSVNGAAPDTLAQGAFDILGAPQQAVPEPAAWALMLLGFGLAGNMLRTHRRLGRRHAA